jgi:MFS family permease
MVPREEFTNAIALNSSVFNLGTIIGPSIAGIVYAWLGPAWCFTINGLTFIPVIGALFLMNVSFRMQKIENKSAISNLLDGVKFSFGHKEIRFLLINLAAVSIFSFSLMTLMPVWSTTVLGGDVKTNGLLLSARGAGSLVAALMIANLGSRVNRGKIWTFGGLVMPFALFFFGFYINLPVSIVMLVILGWSLMSVVNITNALIQTHVPDNLRGRVMSIYVLVLMGSFPLGSLLVGWWADAFTAPVTVIICAIVMACVLGAIHIIHPSIREFN